MNAGRRRTAAVGGGAAALGVISVASGAEASLAVSGTVPKLISGAGAGLAVVFAAVVIVALGLALRGADLTRTAGKEGEGTREQS